MIVRYWGRCFILSRFNLFFLLLLFFFISFFKLLIFTREQHLSNCFCKERDTFVRFPSFRYPINSSNRRITHKNSNQPVCLRHVFPCLWKIIFASWMNIWTYCSEMLANINGFRANKQIFKILGIPNVCGLDSRDLRQVETETIYNSRVSFFFSFYFSSSALKDRKKWGLKRGRERCFFSSEEEVMARMWESGRDRKRARDNCRQFLMRWWLLCWLKHLRSSPSLRFFSSEKGAIALEKAATNDTTPSRQLCCRTHKGIHCSKNAGHHDIFLFPLTSSLWVACEWSTSFLCT